MTATRPLTARTSVAGVIGDPVAHSFSPVIHNAAFAALGLDWVYVGFHVPEGGVATAVDGARALRVRGLSVTMPHKGPAAAAADIASAAVLQLGAANTLVFDGDTVSAEATDGPGFVWYLREDASLDPQGRRCLVAGTGGAARAVVLGLAEAGASEVLVAGRDADRAASAAALAGSRGRVVAPEAAQSCDLVVNAIPAGMSGIGGEGLLGRNVAGGQVLVDLVYDPLETDLVRTARAAGARAANGLGMLVRQAALQFTLFTGEPAPVAAMFAALGPAGEDVSPR